MRNRFRRLPSPALVISVIALVVAVGGGTFAFAALNNAKVKKISTKTANKAITKRAPGLSVSHAKTADSATTANSATAASSATVAISAKTAETANALKAPEAFHEVGTAGNPPFENGAFNYGSGWSTAAFYIDRQCVVHIKGTVTASAPGAGEVTIFTLPSGFRPLQNTLSAIDATGGIGFMEIRTDGTVGLGSSVTGSQNFGLDGTTFRTNC